MKSKDMTTDAIDTVYLCWFSLAGKYLQRQERLGRSLGVAYERARYDLIARHGDDAALTEWVRRNIEPLADPQELAIVRHELAVDLFWVWAGLLLALFDRTDDEMFEN
jgi:hypothetical protein